MATNNNNVLDFEDPGIVSNELLSVPGFVNELKEYTMKVAPRPNEAADYGGRSYLGHEIRDSPHEPNALHVPVLRSGG